MDRAFDSVMSDFRQPWEHFAEMDPYLSILAGGKRVDPQSFWQRGEQIVEGELLPLLRVHGIRLGLSMELGCGIGRLALPLARHFRKVLGVDIAQVTVQRAASFARDNGIKNTAFLSIYGPEDFLQKMGRYIGSFDLIFSLLVFQYIPDFSMIEGYLHVVRVLLQERGLAYLQFDTRPKDSLYRWKNRLPDFLLPRFSPRGIRQIRRSPEEIELCSGRAGMKIVGELYRRTAHHRYILRPAQRPVSFK